MAGCGGAGIATFSSGVAVVQDMLVEFGAGSSPCTRGAQTSGFVPGRRQPILALSGTRSVGDSLDLTITNGAPNAPFAIAVGAIGGSAPSTLLAGFRSAAGEFSTSVAALDLGTAVHEPFLLQATVRMGGGSARTNAVVGALRP